jgi:hypothetical protein
MQASFPDLVFPNDAMQRILDKHAAYIVESITLYVVPWENKDDD